MLWRRRTGPSDGWIPVESRVRDVGSALHPADRVRGEGCTDCWISHPSHPTNDMGPRFLTHLVQPTQHGGHVLRWVGKPRQAREAAVKRSARRTGKE